MRKYWDSLLPKNSFLVAPQPDLRKTVSAQTFIAQPHQYTTVDQACIDGGRHERHEDIFAGRARIGVLIKVLTDGCTMIVLLPPRGDYPGTKEPKARPCDSNHS